MSADFSQIMKRDGRLERFDSNKIIIAIEKAFLASKVEFDSELPKKITADVIAQLAMIGMDSYPTVENVQDIVEKKIAENGYFEVAKAYILYRNERNKERSAEKTELQKVTQKELMVTKKDGTQQHFNKKKLEQTFALASKGYEEVCQFEEMYEILKLLLVKNIKTTDLLHGMKKACLDLISVENIHWQKVAGRLLLIDLYKQATKNRDINFEDVYSPEAVLSHFEDYLAKGYYYKNFLDFYTKEEILEIAKIIDKERDFSYGYSTILAFSKRYLLNPNKITHELPQEMYLFSALFLAIPESKENRLNVAKKIYDITSSQKLSLPTPTLLNSRTNYHQLSSCFKLNVDDDLRSIYHNMENIAQISKFGGGVGVYYGHVRSKGASIRGVKGVSGGVIPWMKVVNDTAIAVNQLGARKGSVSPTIDIWHKDINDFLSMQSESGDIRAKAFDVFPAVSVPDLFMKRVKENAEWTLFDPHEVEQVTGKRLENCYGEEFEKFYIQCEKNKKLELKEVIPAKDLMKVTLKNVVETGMPYFFFRDTVNQVNPNKHAGMVYATQLCTEICQNTSESKFVEEVFEDGTVAIKYQPGDSVVCNLASINVALVNTDEQIKEVFPTAMKILDNVITLNYYPTKESELTAKKYRSVGLGFLGLAEYLAVNKMSYDSAEARGHVDVLFEKYAFATLSASQEIAQEKGAYSIFEGSEWSKGILIGKDQKWFEKNSKTELDWKGLIQRIKKTGLRFAYHLSPAPNTSTAGVVGTTAGLLPIYKKFFIETNIIAPTVTIAPNLDKDNFWFYKEYKNMDMRDVIDMFEVIYKWIDQSASFEWMINPETTSPADLYGYYMRAWEKKIKTVYYVRSFSAEVKDVCVSCSG